MLLVDRDTYSNLLMCRYGRDEADEHKQRALKLQLKLLSHPDRRVRQVVYTWCLSEMRIALEEDCQPKADSWCQKCVILQQDVIREICSFGLNDSSVEVQAVTTAALCMLHLCLAC